MRYGTVPVVHGTGGLGVSYKYSRFFLFLYILSFFYKNMNKLKLYAIQDTVKTFNPFADEGKGEGTGYVFG